VLEKQANDLQSLSARVPREPSRVVHMIIEVTKITVDSGRCLSVDYDTCAAQHHKHMPECCARLMATSPHRLRACA
jgi:hypothetical protein